jgi:hypothetical protein
MTGRLVLACAAVAMLGCGGSAAEPGKVAASPKVATVDAFAGAWSSVTPSYEFIRLSVVSKSVEQGALGARLTLSGLAFDGTAKIDADSLIATMSSGPTGSVNAILVAHVRDAQSLVAQLRAGDGVPLDLTFKRQ